MPQGWVHVLVSGLSLTSDVTLITRIIRRDLSFFRIDVFGPRKRWNFLPFPIDTVNNNMLIVNMKIQVN